HHRQLQALRSACLSGVVTVVPIEPPAHRAGVKRIAGLANRRAPRSFTPLVAWVRLSGLTRVSTRELPKNMHRRCFEAVVVGGKRDDDTKIVEEEVAEVLKRLEQLIRNKSYLTDPTFSEHGYTDDKAPGEWLIGASIVEVAARGER
ncbi:MAG: hypothetical protein ABI611_20000, partial [Solirubrobacteraceae bacterium]